MEFDVAKQLADIRVQLDDRPGAAHKLSLIVFSGDLDRQIASMIIATGAGAMGMEVVMFYTFWGTAALRAPGKKGAGKNIIEKMFGFMLPTGRNRLKLSQMHMAGAGTAMLKGLMKKKNVANLDQLYEVAGELGVKIVICEMSMDLMGFKKEEMIDYPQLSYGGVATFIAEARDSAIQLFI